MAEPSKFARLLHRVLIESRPDFSLDEWAVGLGTTQTEIQSWLDDKRLPSPDRFRAIGEIYKHWHQQDAKFNGINAGFDALLDEFFQDLTPLPIDMRPYISGYLSAYYIHTKFEGFARGLGTLSFKNLDQAVDECLEVLNKYRRIDHRYKQSAP